MRKIAFALALAVMLPLASPVAASPDEVMPEVEEIHDSFLRRLFEGTYELIQRINYDEAKERERARWLEENGHCCGIGIRG